MNQKPTSLHSRKRLTLDATAILISTETDRWSEVTKVMIEKLGETVNTLVQLSDFPFDSFTTRTRFICKRFW